MDKATADDLKAKYPGSELNVFENEEFGVEWVVKTPGAGDYQAFRAQQNGAGDDLVPVLKAFFLNHVVYPSVTEVREKLSKHAALIEPAVKYLMKLAGARAEFTVKKL